MLLTPRSPGCSPKDVRPARRRLAYVNDEISLRITFALVAASSFQK
jgi:hypothetical protein